jgi:hypothetical protein
MVGSTGPSPGHVDFDRRPGPPRRGRRPLWFGLLAVGVVIGVVLGTSEWSGTGAQYVGDAGPSVETPPQGANEGADTAGMDSQTCAATVSNPGGDNNYVPDAPVRSDLGQGFEISGVVRGPDCAPLAGVRVQVWLATATGGERANRASVITGSDGTYRISTDPVRAQFGEPNIHVAYDDAAFRPVFLRNVVDEGDTSAHVDLTLVPR